jgi:ankyrin repeat protein
VRPLGVEEGVSPRRKDEITNSTMTGMHNARAASQSTHLNDGHIPNFIAELLLHRSVDMNVVPDDATWALHFAAYCASPRMVTLLLLHGADVCAKRIDGCTLLHSTSLEGSKMRICLPPVLFLLTTSQTGDEQ